MVKKPINILMQKKLTLLQKAKRSDGRRHICVDCKIHHKCLREYNNNDNDISKWCNENYVSGYIAGYKQSNKDRKNKDKKQELDKYLVYECGLDAKTVFKMTPKDKIKAYFKHFNLDANEDTIVYIVESAFGIDLC